MNLTDRLMKVASFIEKDTRVLDVGTDHGYIPVYLVENNISKKLIASDISGPSLKKTIDIVKERNLGNYIDCRLGNGLEVIEAFEIDGVILAGMGSLLMIDILENDKNITDSIKYFIFQPMVASKELRQYLLENKFTIIDEELAKEDDKFYEIIYAKRGEDFVKEDIYYDISHKLIEKKHPLLNEFIENKINYIENILLELKDKKTPKSIEKYKELTIKKAKYREVLDSIES